MTILRASSEAPPALTRSRASSAFVLSNQPSQKPWFLWPTGRIKKNFNLRINFIYQPMATFINWPISNHLMLISMDHHPPEHPQQWQFKRSKQNNIGVQTSERKQRNETFGNFLEQINYMLLFSVTWNSTNPLRRSIVGEQNHSTPWMHRRSSPGFRNRINPRSTHKLVLETVCNQGGTGRISCFEPRPARLRSLSDILEHGIADRPCRNHEPSSQLPKPHARPSGSSLQLHVRG